MTAYTAAKAVVLTTDGVFYDNGKTHPLSLPLGTATDLGHVLSGAARAFAGEGVAVIDVSRAELAQAMDKTPLHAEDWRLASSELRAWSTFVRTSDKAVIHLGLLPELDESPGPLLEGHQGAADVAWRLGRYAAVTGHPWRFTAGVSGSAGLRARFTDPRPGKQPLWRHPGQRGMRGAGPLIWRAKDQPEGSGHVHIFDVNAMYLAGLRNALMAWGELAPTGSMAFDHGRPGYWEIDTGHVPAELYDGIVQPPIFPAGRVHKGAVWLSTPTAKLLAEQGVSLDVLDSWTSDNPHPIGRTYAERLMSARLGQLGPMGPATLAVKRTYAELVGMMGRPGGSIHRPDWADTVMDLARANMLRRVFKTAAALCWWPFAVRTDAVYYYDPTTVDSPPALGQEALRQVLGVGPGAGSFKYQETLTVDEYRARLSAGVRK